MNRKKIIEKIIDNYEILSNENLIPEELPSYLAEELSRIEKIANSQINFLRKEQKLKDKYEEDKKSLRAELVKLQEGCPHYDTSYHPDPSGNNDSDYECNICGKWSSRPL